MNPDEILETKIKYLKDQFNALFSEICGDDDDFHSIYRNMFGREFVDDYLDQ